MPRQRRQRRPAVAATLLPTEPRPRGDRQGGFGRPFLWCRPALWHGDGQAHRCRSARQPQHSAVTTQQPARARGVGQIEKLLVVGVVAMQRDTARQACRLGDHLDVSVPGRQHDGGVGLPRSGQTTAQHACKLTTHCLGGNPADPSMCDCRSERCRRPVTEQQPVKHHVGVEHDQSWL